MNFLVFLLCLVLAVVGGFHFMDHGTSVFGERDILGSMAVSSSNWGAIDDGCWSLMAEIDGRQAVLFKPGGYLSAQRTALLGFINDRAYSEMSCFLESVEGIAFDFVSEVMDSVRVGFALVDGCEHTGAGICSVTAERGSIGNESDNKEDGNVSSLCKPIKAALLLPSMSKDFPESMFCTTKQYSQQLGGVCCLPVVGDFLSANGDGCFSRSSSGEDACVDPLKVVCGPTRSYPFAKVLPWQRVEVLEVISAVEVKAEVVFMLPLLRVSDDLVGANCVCRRPYLGSITRFIPVSSDLSQRRGLRKVMKGVKVDQDIVLCDYACLIRYVGDMYRARPVKGHRRINVDSQIVEALEALAFDVSPMLQKGSNFVLSEIQLKLLSGWWPLCVDAARAVFKQSVAYAERNMSVILLDLELFKRRGLFDFYSAQVMPFGHEQRHFHFGDVDLCGSTDDESESCDLACDYHVGDFDNYDDPDQYIYGSDDEWR